MSELSLKEEEEAAVRGSGCRGVEGGLLSIARLGRASCRGSDLSWSLRKQGGQRW